MKLMNEEGSKFRLPKSWSSHIRPVSSRSASVGSSNGVCATMRMGLTGTRLRVRDAYAEWLSASNTWPVPAAANPRGELGRGVTPILTA
jgi:hypothetical protein